MRARAADVIARDLSGELGPEELLRANDRGRLARWASADDGAQVAGGLLDTLTNLAEIGAHRYEAGEGLASLAERLEPEVAGRTLDRMLENQAAVAMPSTDTGGQSHPNRFFARVVMDAPPAVGQVRSVALRAACALADRCGRLTELRETIELALTDDAPEMREAAARTCLRADELPDPDLRALVTDTAAGSSGARARSDGGSWGADP